MPEEAVLGLRPHTYWTAAVALAQGGEGPQVVERRRIEFALGRERFVYHQAADDPASAPRLIAEVREAVQRRAAGEIGRLAEELGRRGRPVRLAVVPRGPAFMHQELKDIIRHHADMHVAEGQFYRDAVAAACETVGLEVRRVVEKTIMSLGSEVLRLDGASLQARLKALGAGLGPPWNEDYRMAALGAWLNLEQGAGDRDAMPVP